MRYDDEVPESSLQALRLARAWSQMRLAVELERVAGLHGQRLQVRTATGARVASTCDCSSRSTTWTRRH